MASVFDQGGFNERVKIDRLSSPKPNQAKPDTTKHIEWKEGFEAGYKSAIDRYIPIYKE